METMQGALNALFSDPESLRQLQELAQLLQESTAPESESKSEPDARPDAPSQPESDAGGLDLRMLLGLQELLGSMQSDDADTQLLLALRPHLKRQRQKKVDQAVKLLKVWTVFRTVQKNGMLQELLG